MLAELRLCVQTAAGVVQIGVHLLVQPGVVWWPAGRPRHRSLRTRGNFGGTGPRPGSYLRARSSSQCGLAFSVPATVVPLLFLGALLPRSPAVVHGDLAIVHTDVVEESAGCGGGTTRGRGPRSRALRPTHMTSAPLSAQMAAPTVNAERRPSPNPSPAAVKNALAQVSRCAEANEGPRAQPLSRDVASSAAYRDGRAARTAATAPARWARS